MNTKLVIVHTESHRAWGGQEFRVFTECRWMQALGHEVHLVAGKNAQITGRAKDNGIPCHTMGFTNPAIFADYFRLKSLFNRIRPHVVNTHGNLDGKVAGLAARKCGVPLVIRSRHNSHPVHPSWYNRKLYRDVSHLVFTTAGCISRQVTEDLQVPANRVFTVASGILPPSPLPDPLKSQKAIAAELGLPEEARFIGCVARLEEGKGQDDLIEAFAVIQKDFPFHHLLFLGEGRDREKLILLAKNKGLSENVHFMGFREDPWPFFAAFDTCVLASTTNEGIPQVLLQAMNAGTPVIGADSGGIPDIVISGKTGILIPPHSPQALAEALKKTLTPSPHTEEQTRNAFLMVSEHYTLDSMGKRILEIYDQHLFRDPS